VYGVLISMDGDPERENPWHGPTQAYFMLVMSAGWYKALEISKTDKVPGPTQRPDFGPKATSHYSMARYEARAGISKLMVSTAHNGWRCRGKGTQPPPIAMMSSRNVD